MKARQLNWPAELFVLLALTNRSVLGLAITSASATTVYDSIPSNLNNLEASSGRSLSQDSLAPVPTEIVHTIHPTLTIASNEHLVSAFSENTASATAGFTDIDWKAGPPHIRDISQVSAASFTKDLPRNLDNPTQIVRHIPLRLPHYRSRKLSPTPLSNGKVVKESTSQYKKDHKPGNEENNRALDGRRDNVDQVYCGGLFGSLGIKSATRASFAEAISWFNRVFDHAKIQQGGRQPGILGYYDANPGVRPVIYLRIMSTSSTEEAVLPEQIESIFFRILDDCNTDTVDNKYGGWAQQGDIHFQLYALTAGTSAKKEDPFGFHSCSGSDCL